MRQQLSRGVLPVTREEMLIADNAESSLRMDSSRYPGRARREHGRDAHRQHQRRARRASRRAVGDLARLLRDRLLPHEPRVRRALPARSALKVTRPGRDACRPAAATSRCPRARARPPSPTSWSCSRALRGTPAPHDFPLRARAFHFGYEEGSLRHTVVHRDPARAAMRLRGRPGRAVRIGAHFSFMGLVRSPVGRRWPRSSARTMPLSPCRADRLEALRQGNAVFLRSFVLRRRALQPRDRGHGPAESEQKTVERRPVERPRGAARPSLLSSLAVIKRVEPRRRGRPRVGRPLPGRREPHRALGERARGDAAGSPLSLFLVAYAPSRRPQAARAPARVLAGRPGRRAIRARALPPADAKGRIPYIACIPAARFTPGLYEVRAELK